MNLIELDRALRQLRLGGMAAGGEVDGTVIALDALRPAPAAPAAHSGAGR